MLVDKKRVRAYYRQLKEDMPDLCHEWPEVAEEWVKKAQNLQLVGAWYHYKILIRKAKEYVKRNCPCYFVRFQRILKRNE